MKRLKNMNEQERSEFFKKIGSRGGKNGVGKPKGFASMTPERHREVASRGGKNKVKTYAEESKAYAEAATEWKIISEQPH